MFGKGKRSRRNEGTRKCPGVSSTSQPPEHQESCRTGKPLLELESTSKVPRVDCEISENDGCVLEREKDWGVISSKIVCHRHIYLHGSSPSLMLMDKGPHFFLFVTLWKTGELKKGMLINNFGTNEHLNKGSFQKGSFRQNLTHCTCIIDCHSFLWNSWI